MPAAETNRVIWRSNPFYKCEYGAPLLSSQVRFRPPPPVEVERSGAFPKNRQSRPVLQEVVR